MSVPKQIVATDARQLEEEATREDWEAVVQLYQGPFMDQFTLPRAAEFEQWQTATRARIARLARRGFARVVKDGAERGDLKSALSTAYRWAELEPLEDEAQHTLIALLAQVGRRKEALSHFADYRDRLRQELEVDALDETLELVERIRAGGIPGAISLEAATRSRREAKERGGGHRLLDDSGAVISTDLEALLKDELGSRLQIVRLLREGSTASVYLAREPGLRRLVAVKVFSPSLASDSRARMRFERESQAIASLSHPNIVTV